MANTETAARPDKGDRSVRKPADSPGQRAAVRDYMEFHGEGRVIHAEGDITINADPARW